ncbi:DMT family transporter [Tolypothrix sp. FACHB-123]|uniref:DMT family transporter n=1 Tax=Tolypothrix sp. FACHB-123 TaxID=2692868 RepID=UPI001686AA49|nr:DMT family transporter [Tolypothrix sp. FACHB-123]MBD2353136.1 DMT family transporter [Tolypothrix sp. FACHB-123]
MDILFALIGAGSGGSFVAIGAAANARLRQTLHSPIAAAAINFIVGFTTITVMIITGIFSTQNLDRLVSVPWWAFLGGLLGAIFVTLNTIVIPRLGLTTTTLAVVCSQMILSLVIDQFGWFAIAPHPVNPYRVVAIGLLLVAVTLTQLDQPSHSK